MNAESHLRAGVESDRASCPLTLRLFGPFAAGVGGAPLPRLRARKGQWLLALLTLHAHREVERAWLAGTLWPDSPEPQAFNNLRVNLSDLRRALGPEADRLQSPTIHSLRLDLSGAEADLLVFDQAIACGGIRALEQAVALYRGPLLEGCAEPWAFQERQAREQAYLGALETLARHAEETGDPAAAERYLRRAVAADPLRESTQRTLMQALAEGGNYAAALVAYRELRLLLHREVNAEPDPETRALFEQIRTEARRHAETSPRPQGALLRPGKRRGRSSSPLCSRAARHNLPFQLTSFIGREPQIAEIRRLMRGRRLVTLTGAGGCGKTRLALQVAANVLEEYPDGVWLVELAALTDPALVPQTMAGVLGVREEPNRLITATLIEYLRPRSLLLLLDNCEHVLMACAQLAATLLQSCPTFRILASSREGLGIGGEQTYRVPSLSLPEPHHVPSPERILEFEALQLFADRARLSQPSFTVTPTNAAAVVQVCHRLDGIPLALELAAARVKVLSVEQIAARLDDRFRLLTGGSRTALPRHQTLRALIDWSYDLVSEAERTLLRRLSVFHGGWTLEAAEAVCTGDNIEEGEILNLLTRLVEQSLVVYEERGGAGGAGGGPWGLDPGRYRLLETVRQYARDRLSEAGAARAMRDRHQRWFLEFAERAEPELYRPGQAAWLDRLEEEHDNLWAALVWAAEGEAVTARLRLGAALHRFWFIRGYVAEGRECLAQLLTRETAQYRTAARARALVGAGVLARFQLDHAAARVLLEEGLAIWRDLGDERGIISALLHLAAVLRHQGSEAEARSLLEEGLVIQKPLGHTLTLAFLNSELGLSAFNQGAYDTARSCFQTSLQIKRAWGDRWGIGWSLLNLGQVGRRQGTEEQARRSFEEAMMVYREVDDPRGIAYCLEELGGIAIAQGAVHRGVKLLGAADRVGDMVGVRLDSMARREYEHDVAAARAALGEEAFAAAWAAGRAMSLDNAIVAAIEGETTVISPSSTEPPV